MYKVLMQLLHIRFVIRRMHGKNIFYFNYYKKHIIL